MRPRGGAPGPRPLQRQECRRRHPRKAIAGSTTTLQNHLVACTRMLRADDCGDGTSYTVNGTTINLYDGVVI
ncbi:MAG TPA: ADYC domain-containing protein [Polyangiaceae bacterium]|nr:ADYC domain-containing protein [Polyangiaceae bacterium]